MVDFQQDFLKGEPITQDVWIVKLEIQGNYTETRLIEIAGLLRVVAKKYGPDSLLRMTMGHKKGSDKIIDSDEKRRCLRFFVYNIDKLEAAKSMRDKLELACNFLGIKHRFIELRPKPATIYITPDRVRIRRMPFRYGQRSQ